ncbi:MAG: nucleoside-diphosphate kinase [SAR202 cluster bacterium]|nr:nucleoside-diphosphate kinase [SAR202 cluster bacterium]
MQKTLVLAKPDAVQRGLIGELVGRIERRGLKIVGMKMMRVTEELARKHYSAHVDKPFFLGLLKFITSSPIVAIAVEGPNAVELVRNLMGATNPSKAAQGTVRGDLAVQTGPNLIHGSDSEESAAKELALFFGKGEILSYERDIDRWVIES